jgi:hypothetical protein
MTIPSNQVGRLVPKTRHTRHKFPAIGGKYGTSLPKANQYRRPILGSQAEKGR